MFQNRGSLARRAGLFAALFLVVALVPAPWGSAPGVARAASPDTAVLDWNQYAMDALANAPSAPTPGVGQPPPVVTQHLAMVQGAVYDAVNMISRTHQPYLAGLPSAPRSASKAAAVATAAHDVLVGLTMTPPLSQAIVDRLGRLRDESIAAATAQDGAAAVQAGVAAGQAAATRMLEARQDDGRYGSFRFSPGESPGVWAPTPPAFINDPFGWIAKVQPFLLKSRSQFRTKGPLKLKTGAYAKEYQEVKDFGGNGTTTPTLRTAEQTALARFYTVNPVEMFSRTFRAISAARGLTLVEQARLFAMLNISGADTFINCWDDKAHWNFWRPITAIRRGEHDGNKKTVGDSQWTSLVPSPPYPDHPSGFNCITGALMEVGEAFFGTDKMPFSVTATIGTPPAPVTRNYVRFTDVVKDTIDARMYLGIHFRSPDEQGAKLGRDVARWAAKNYFQPVKNKSKNKKTKK